MRCSLGSSKGDAATGSCCASVVAGEEAVFIAPTAPAAPAGPAEAEFDSDGTDGVSLSFGLTACFGVSAVGGIDALGLVSRVRITTASTRPMAIAPQNQSEPRDCDASEERAGNGLGSEGGCGRAGSGVDTGGPSAEGEGSGSWLDCD